MSPQAHLSQHIAVFRALDPLLPKVERAAEVVARSLQAGGKVMLCGNGGSAADAQHLAAELVGRFRSDRSPLAGLSLACDTSALTAIGNDYGFDHVFARQVSGLGRQGDVLIGISTSGGSRNVAFALRTAQALGIHTIGLLGRDGGQCAGLCDVPLVVRCDDTARIQEAHIFMGHLLCDLVEAALWPDPVAAANAGSDPGVEVPLLVADED